MCERHKGLSTAVSSLRSSKRLTKDAMLWFSYSSLKDDAREKEGLWNCDRRKSLRVQTPGDQGDKLLMMSAQIVATLRFLCCACGARQHVRVAPCSLDPEGKVRQLHAFCLCEKR